MAKPRTEEYLKALAIVTNFDDGFIPESDLPFEVQMRGIMKAIRTILRVKEAESVLARVVIVMRRHDAMSKELGKDYI